jgi:hypothetical protein
MIRTLSLAMTFVVALALPVLAEDASTKIEPGTGPTSTMSNQVPQMKSDADATKAIGSTPANPLPAAKAMNDVVPPMRPGDAVSGQTANKTGAVATATSAGLTLTEQEGDSWIKKPVYSNDGKKIGAVVSFQRDANNKVIGMHADIGGYFGFGRSRVNFTPAQFRLQGDRVELDLTAAEAKALPVIHI